MLFIVEGKWIFNVITFYWVIFRIFLHEVANGLPQLSYRLQYDLEEVVLPLLSYLPLLLWRACQVNDEVSVLTSNKTTTTVFEIKPFILIYIVFWRDYTVQAWELLLISTMFPFIPLAIYHSKQKTNAVSRLHVNSISELLWIYERLFSRIVVLSRWWGFQMWFWRTVGRKWEEVISGKLEDVIWFSQQQEL